MHFNTQLCAAMEVTVDLYMITKILHSKFYAHSEHSTGSHFVTLQS